MALESEDDLAVVAARLDQILQEAQAELKGMLNNLIATLAGGMDEDRLRNLHFAYAETIAVGQQIGNEAEIPPEVELELAQMMYINMPAVEMFLEIYRRVHSITDAMEEKVDPLRRQVWGRPGPVI